MRDPAARCPEIRLGPAWDLWLPPKSQRWSRDDLFRLIRKTSGARARCRRNGVPAISACGQPDELKGRSEKRPESSCPRWGTFAPEMNGGRGGAENKQRTRAYLAERSQISQQNQSCDLTSPISSKIMPSASCSIPRCL